MSDAPTTVEEIWDLAEPALEDLGDKILDRFLDDVDTYVDSAKARSSRMVDALRAAKTFKIRCLTAKDEKTARECAAAYDTAIRRVKTLALAERVVAEQNLAAAFSAALKTALDGLATVAKGLGTTILEGLVSGAIKGFGGGAVGDIASLFQFFSDSD